MRRLSGIRCTPLLAVCLLGWLVIAPSARAASPGETLGVYAGAGDPAAVADFERHIGRPVSLVHDSFAKETWSAIESPQWWTSTWGASAYESRMMFTVPMLPDSGGSLAAGAAGDYDAHFVTLAQRLVEGGQANAILRLGHEFNGDWYRWSIGVANGAGDYAAYWRRIVTAMRSVAGAQFRFDWTANSGSSWSGGQPLDAAAAYPGDAYVDFIGLDQFDHSWIDDRADPAARWREYLDQPFGLRWHTTFASVHGKPMTFGEWGLAQRADGYGGGDSPEFVTRMYEWIRDNDVAYHAYFNYADANIDARLFGGLFPNASARFIELFGTTAPPPPPPADYAATVTADAPAAYWRLGEASGATAADAQGTSPGAYRGLISLGQPGLIAASANTAVSLNGTSQYVTVPHTAALATSDTFSLEAWLNRRLRKRSEAILSKGSGGYQLYVNRSNQLTLAKVGSGDIVRSTVGLSSAAAHHVVATKSAGVVRLYIDGVDRTGTVTNHTISPTTNALMLGVGPAGYFAGILDEVAVYPRALTSSDASRHYAAGD